MKTLSLGAFATCATCARWIKRTNHSTFVLCLSASFVVLVLLFFNPGWLREYPEVEVYQGEVSFSGASAFEYLETLVTQFPDRQIGRPNALGSAQWVAREFEELGVAAHLEEFTRLGVGAEVVQHISAGEMDLAFRGELRDLSPNSILEAYTGVNVVGVLPGQVEDRVVIGAHRDIAGSVQGAEDNGSGTAAVLELARVLSGRDNYYTYVFISFDGEEVGLTGAFDYVWHHARDPVVVAVVLDMTGFEDSDTVAFYRGVTGQGSCPLWTFALARSVMEFQGLPGRFFDTRYLPGSLRTFFATLFERVSGEWSTDSGSFLAANIPAIGLTAAGLSEEYKGHPARAVIHTLEDTIEQVSPEVLEMTGRFVERYVKSLELNRGGFGAVLNSRYFTHAGSHYLSPWALWGFMLLSFMVVLLVPIASWKAMVQAGGGGQAAELGAEHGAEHGAERGAEPAAEQDPEQFGQGVCFRQGVGIMSSFVARERVRMVSVAVIALAATCLWQVYRLERYRSLPFRVMTVAWFSSVLGGTLLVSAWRYISNRRRAGLPRGGGSSILSSGNSSYRIGRYNGAQFFLDVLLAASFLVAALVFNPFVGLALTAVPLLVVNRMNPVTRWRKVLLLAVLSLWTIAHAILSAGLLVPYAFSLDSPKVFLLMLLCTSSWMYTVIYGF